MKLETGAIPPTRDILRTLSLYVVFGLLSVALDYTYCTYREAHGNPSDLPCVSALWSTMELVAWPVLAVGDLVDRGPIVLVPTWVVNIKGALLLGGFAASLAWASLRGRALKGAKQGNAV